MSFLLPCPCAACGHVLTHVLTHVPASMCDVCWAAGEQKTNRYIKGQHAGLLLRSVTLPPSGACRLTHSLYRTHTHPVWTAERTHSLKVSLSTSLPCSIPVSHFLSPSLQVAAMPSQHKAEALISLRGRRRRGEREGGKRGGEVKREERKRGKNQTEEDRERQKR